MPAATFNPNARFGPTSMGQSESSLRSGRQCTNSALEKMARELLESHLHFQGRSQFVQCRCIGNRLCLDGCLPSYYLKQLAQEALRELSQFVQLENRIVVVSPVGEVICKDIEMAQSNSLPLEDCDGRYSRKPK